MQIHILTMSRGDSPRLKDWILYHHKIGVDQFHIILDAPIDKSETLLKQLAQEHQLELDITVKESQGEYFDDLTSDERFAAIKNWKTKNAAYIANTGLPIVDPLSDRQYKYLPEKLEQLSRAFPDDWVAIIDVDEYIALPGTASLKSLIEEAKQPRLRLLNFNFDMSDWTVGEPVRNQVYRWSRKDIVEYGKGWENRVKSVVKLSHALPMVSVHAISRGPYETLPATVARLHHYKYPNQKIKLNYAVIDSSISLANKSQLAGSKSETLPKLTPNNTGTLNNLSNASEFLRLAKTIIDYSNFGSLVFSPAKGNWGDGLINIGTRQFLKALGLPVTERNKSTLQDDLAAGFFKDKVVLMGGGGAWSRNFNNARKFTEQIAQQAKHVVVLPTTFDLPAVEARNVTYFARDRYSSIKTIPSASFCHDMAFFIDLNIDAPANRIWRLFAMRSDREGLDLAKLVPNNFDLSRLGDGDYTFAEPLFNILNNFNVICTDRMHLAIASAMLGRTVKLVPGNYPKSRDVYASSIRESFPNVQLVPKEELLEWINPTK